MDAYIEASLVRTPQFSPSFKFWAERGLRRQIAERTAKRPHAEFGRNLVSPEHDIALRRPHADREPSDYVDQGQGQEVQER
jgi:hypothetical protein